MLQINQKFKKKKTTDNNKNLTFSDIFKLLVINDVVHLRVLIICLICVQYHENLLYSLETLCQ